MTTFHNGTDIHGRARAWLRIGADLSLAVAYRSVLDEEYTVDSRGGCGIVRGRLVRGADGALREDVWFENPAFGVGPRHVPPEVGARIREYGASEEPLLEPWPRVR